MSDPTDTPPTEDPLVRLRELNERRLRQEREAVKARYRRRIVAAGGIDPESLSEQGRRILRWLCEWDDWTVGGLEEILGAARTAARVTVHREGIDRKVAALGESDKRTEAAFDRFDERGGLGL